MRRLARLAAASAAAYAPIPALELSTHVRGEAPAITASYTQADGETATKRITSTFPSAFTYNPDLDVAGCTPADEEAGACPPDSRLGTLATESPFGTAEGPVHLMRDLRLVAFLSAYGGLYSTRVTGTTAIRDDGSFVLTFDQLPDLPVRSSLLRMEGGSRALILVPRRCRDYAIEVALLSHADEAVARSVPVTVEGCPADVVVRRPRRAGRALRWTVSEAADTQVVLLRRARGTWRQVGTWRRTGTSLRLPRLRAGRYRALLRATTPDGRTSPARSLRFVVASRAS